MERGQGRVKERGEEVSRVLRENKGRGGKESRMEELEGREGGSLGGKGREGKQGKVRGNGNVRKVRERKGRVVMSGGVEKSR